MEHNKDNIKLKVLIIGGGISGLALAQSLRKEPAILFDVFERDDDGNYNLMILHKYLLMDIAMSRFQGYRISIHGEGREALEYCLPEDLYHEFIATNNETQMVTLMTVCNYLQCSQFICFNLIVSFFFIYFIF